MNKSLPIAKYRDEIITAVKGNRVTIIKAETGAGKSTQVPQFLLECASKIVVTQPRRLAATSIAQRIAQEMQCEVGGVVGYRTSLDRKDGPDTRILLCTDGLELVSQLLGGEIPEGILAIDEVHEWNLNIETLIAWSRHQLKKGASHKLVIMSATLEPILLAHYFGGAAIVEVPGRAYPVTELRPAKGMLGVTLELLEQEHNVLVFQPGKNEIRKMAEQLKAKGINAEILPLHAEMSVMDQVPCFLTYRRPKCVIATNIAQTSVTIPDIDAVIDSGMERRAEYAAGVDGLYLRPISLADREQRKGRAGRTKPGIYADMCPAELKTRDLVSKADIVRLPMDKVVLQLASMGVKAEELEFYHQPKAEQIAEARKVLRNLGCLNEDDQVTEIGQRVASLPISTRFARMLIEAGKRKVLPDLITLVSIMEQGGIIVRSSPRWRNVVGISSWSDAFVQLEAYEVAQKLPARDLEASGVEPRSFERARDMRHRLYAALSHTGRMKRSTGREEDIVRSIYAGVPDLIFKKSLVKGYRDKEGKYRNLPDGSVVADAEEVVGLPWNLQVKTDFGPKTFRLITMATRLNRSMLREVAPQAV